MSLRSGFTPAYRVKVLELPRPDGWAPHDRSALDDWSISSDRTVDGSRLPTEAEWQLACRAGTSGPHYGPLAEIAWHDANSGMRRRAVGEKEPNGWGLGGVWEWCWDLFDVDVYGPYRIIRGGSWADPTSSCRAGVRRKTQPTAHLDDLGLRLARTAAAELTRNTVTPDVASPGQISSRRDEGQKLHKIPDILAQRSKITSARPAQ